MTDSDAASSAEVLLEGQRVAIVGKLAGMSKREAQQLLRQHGAAVVEHPDSATTLVIVGEHDAISSPDEMRAIADGIPKAEFQIIAGAGHMSPCEAPIEFNGALEDFLSRRLPI